MRLFASVATLAFVGLCAALPQQAVACSPGLEDFHYPSCTILLPASSEIVSVVQAAAPYPKAPVHPGISTRDTVVATITIAPSEMRHYLVLDSPFQVIWRIEGDTDSVSRVIVLGARNVGPAAAGVIGIPTDKVHFTYPNISGLQSNRVTTCSQYARTCTASQWFGPSPSDKILFHPTPTQPRVEGVHEVRPRHHLAKASDWPVDYFIPEDRDEVVTFDPALVVTRRTTEATP